MGRMTLVCVSGGNSKLGAGVATTYRPVGVTCPRDCGMLEECYARRGRVCLVARRSEGRDDPLRALAGNTLVRHLVSGDWLRPTADGRRVVDRELLREAIEVHSSAPWLVGWGYTHAADQIDRVGLGPGSGCWPSNFVVLASCESLERARELQSRGWRTARVIQRVEDRAAGELLCPVDAQKRAGVESKSRTTCARCRACFEGERNVALLQF